MKREGAWASEEDETVGRWESVRESGDDDSVSRYGSDSRSYPHSHNH